MRLAGQVIWATEFRENVTRRGGGKGAPQPKVEEFSYSISLAIGLCQGEILKVGRIWADGNEIAPGSLNLRVYSGGEDQQPDPRIEAVEGIDNAPAYRGLAYVVIEDLGCRPLAIGCRNSRSSRAPGPMPRCRALVRAIWSKLYAELR